MTSNRPVVTLDGGAGAGKSTLAGNLARELGLPVFDTGSIYRALTHHLLTWCGVTHDALLAGDLATLTNVIRTVQALADGGIEIRDGVVWTVGGWVISEAERQGPAVEAAVALVSPIPEVREVARRVQREFAAAAGCVVEGRDCGIEVFPDAEHRLYITADDAKRAERHAKRKHGGTDHAALLAAVRERDQRDMQREHGRLVPPFEALALGYKLLDTTNMDEAQALAAALLCVTGHFPRGHNCVYHDEHGQLQFACDYWPSCAPVTPVS